MIKEAINMGKKKNELPDCPWHSGIACNVFEESGHLCEKCAWGDPNISLIRLANKYGDKIFIRIKRGEKLLSDRRL